MDHRHPDLIRNHTGSLPPSLTPPLQKSQKPPVGTILIPLKNVVIHSPELILLPPPQQPELTNRWRHLLTDRGISGDSATPVEKGTATQEPGQSERRRGQNANSLSDSPAGIPHWGLGLFKQDQAHNRHRLEHQHEEK